MDAGHRLSKAHRAKLGAFLRSHRRDHATRELHTSMCTLDKLMGGMAVKAEVVERIAMLLDDWAAAPGGSDVHSHASAAQEHERLTERVTSTPRYRQ